MLVAWAKRAGVDFTRAAMQVCTDGLRWPSDYCSWFMACIAWESDETFSASIKNKAGSGATGLIQIMPATAEWLGVTTDALAGMTAIEQLEYVRRYFQPYAVRIRSLADMYMAILLPHYIGAAGTARLFTDGTKAYRQNSGLDENSDGVITKDEAVERVREKLALGWSPQYAGRV